MAIHSLYEVLIWEKKSILKCEKLKVFEVETYLPIIARPTTQLTNKVIIDRFPMIWSWLVILWFDICNFFWASLPFRYLCISTLVPRKTQLINASKTKGTSRWKCFSSLSILGVNVPRQINWNDTNTQLDYSRCSFKPITYQIMWNFSRPNKLDKLKTKPKTQRCK